MLNTADFPPRDKEKTLRYTMNFSFLYREKYYCEKLKLPPKKHTTSTLQRPVTNSVCGN